MASISATGMNTTPIPLIYGVNINEIGPAGDSTTTTGDQATTGTITSVLASASPGDVILLRAGTYSGNETVPNGSSGSPITLRPYDSEAVTITGDWTYGNYNTFRAFIFDSSGRSWTIDVGHNGNNEVNDVKWLYCDMSGGSIETMRLARGVSNIEVGWCRFLNGGDTQNHCLKTHYESSASSPTNINIHHCDFSHSGVTRTQGDLVQMEGWNGTNYVEHCNFHDEDQENALDIKPPRNSGGTLYVRWNHFDHDTISNAALLDQSDGGVAQSNTIIWYNYFPGSSAGAVITLGGDIETDGYTDFQWNIIPDAPGRIAFWNLTDAIFNHNLIGPADMELDVTAGTRPILRLAVTYNRFDGTDLNDKNSGGSDYSGSDNEKNSVTGGTDWDPIGAGTAQYPITP